MLIGRTSYNPDFFRGKKVDEIKADLKKMKLNENDASAIKKGIEDLDKAAKDAEK